MQRGLLSLLISTACLCCGTSAASGRILENWSYKRLFKKSDLVVIATAVSTKDASDSFVDKLWPLKFVGRNTKFKVLQRLKGKVRGKQIVVLHFAVGKALKKDPAGGDGLPLIIDGPNLVSFRIKPANVKVAGTELFAHKFEYLLFLKKRADRRYEPVSGRIDPNLSIRDLFPLPQ
jgi:hypothetical protein